MENNINGANTPGLAAQILARYRQTAQKFGPFFGHLYNFFIKKYRTGLSDV